MPRVLFLSVLFVLPCFFIVSRLFDSPRALDIRESADWEDNNNNYNPNFARVPWGRWFDLL